MDGHRHHSASAGGKTPCGQPPVQGHWGKQEKSLLALHLLLHGRLPRCSPLLAGDKHHTNIPLTVDVAWIETDTDSEKEVAQI